jgi:hypothetical protein
MKRALFLAAALLCLGTGADALTPGQRTAVLSGGRTPIVSDNFLAAALPGGVTVTRLSTAQVFNSSGVLVSSGANQPRFDYNPTTLALNGLYSEETRTNVALWSRDLTNVAWVKTTATVALDQTGLDGIASSASSFLATGANSTVLQTVTAASNSDDYAVWIKQLVGSGEIDLTIDGTTFVAMNSARCAVAGTPTAINGTNWTRCHITQAGVTNPVIGIRLVVNGDKIAVDQSQLEIGATFPSSDLITTTVSVTRAQEVVKRLSSTFALNPAGGTFAAQFMTPFGANAAGRIVANQGSWGILIVQNALVAGGSVSMQEFDGTSTVTSVGGPITTGQISKGASSYGAGMAISSNGTTPVTNTSFDSTQITGTTSIGYGSGVTGAFAGSIYIRGVQYYRQRFTGSSLQLLTQ